MAVNKLLKLIKDDAKVETDFTEGQVDALYSGELRKICKRHKDCFYFMNDYIHEISIDPGLDEIENQNPDQVKIGKSNPP